MESFALTRVLVGLVTSTIFSISIFSWVVHPAVRDVTLGLLSMGVFSYHVCVVVPVQIIRLVALSRVSSTQTPMLELARKQQECRKEQLKTATMLFSFGLKVACIGLGVNRAWSPAEVALKNILWTEMFVSLMYLLSSPILLTSVFACYKWFQWMTAQDCCSICLETKDNDGNIAQLQCCGQCYHAECLESWFKRCSTCPLCRRYVSTYHKFESAPKQLSNSFDIILFCAWPF